MTISGRFFILLTFLALAGCGGGVQSGDTESKFEGVQTAAAISPTSVKINWKKNVKIKEYSIFESGSNSALQKTIFDNTIVKDLRADTTYTFKVVGESDATLVGMEKEMRVRTWPRFTGATSMESLTADTILAKWDYTEKPLAYLVYVSVDTPPTEASTNGWKNVTATTTSRTYTITGVLPSKTYYVTVHAQYTSDEYERPATTLSLRSGTTFKTPKYDLSKISIGTLPYITVDPIADATHLKTEFRSQAYWKGNPVSDPLQGAGNLVFSSSAGLPIGKVEDISLKIEYGSGATLESQIIEGLSTYIKGIASHIEKPQSTTLPQGASYFGKALAHGDFNCDGGQDLAIGVPDIALAEYGITRPGVGAIFIYYSKKVGDRYVLQTSPAPSQNPAVPGVDPQIITMDDLTEYSAFGTSLAAGNMNGDKLGTASCDDLLAGSPGYSGNRGWTGSAFLFFGSSNGLRTSSHVRDMALNTETCDGKVEGATCVGVVIMPDPSSVPTTLTGGSSYMPYSGVGGGGTSGMRFGQSVAFIGDFDANGYEDVAIGAPDAAWAGPINGYFANSGYLGYVGMVSIFVGSRFGLGKADYSGQTVREINVFPPIPEGGMKFGSSVSGGVDVDGRNKIRLANGSLVGGAELIVGAPNFSYADYSTKSPLKTSIGATAGTSIVAPAGGGWLAPGGNLSDTTNYYGWRQNSGTQVGAAFLYYGYSRTSAASSTDFDNASDRNAWWSCGSRGMATNKHFSCLASTNSYALLFPRNSSTVHFGSAVALVGDSSRFKANTNETIEPRTSSDPSVPYMYFSDANGDGYGDIIVAASASNVGSRLGVGNLWQFFGNPNRWFGATDLYNVTNASTPTPTSDYTVNGAACDIFNSSTKKVNCVPTLLQSTSLAANTALGGNQNQIAVGDVTGDGLKDVVVGAPGEATIGSKSGAILVYPSSKGVGITSSYKKLYGLQTTANDTLGTSVTVGDFNGDFFSYQENPSVVPATRPLMDVFGGAPTDTSQMPSVGIVLGFLTSNSMPLPSIMPSSSDGNGNEFVLYERKASFSNYGAGDASLVGDINGDGKEDAVTKLTSYFSDGTLKTDAVIFFGSDYGLITKDFCLLHKDIVFLNGASASDSLCYPSSIPVVGVTKPGISLPQKIPRPANMPGVWFSKAVSAGDVNKDGFGDVIFYGSYQTLVFFGARGGLQNVVDPSFTPNAGDPQIVTGNAYQGMDGFYDSSYSTDALSTVQRSRVTVGDFNGDGYADVVFGIPNKTSPSMNSNVGDDTWLRPGETGVASGGGWNCGAGTTDNECLSGTAVYQHGMILVYYGSSRGYQTPAVQGLATGDVDIGAPGTINMLDSEQTGANKPCTPVSGDASRCYVGYLRNPVWENIPYGFNRLAHYFGASVASIKADKDVFDDVLVGAPNFTDISCYSKTTPPSGYGRIYVFYGSKDGLLAGARDDYYRWERTGLTCPVQASADVSVGDPAYGIRPDTLKVRAISPPPVNLNLDNRNRTSRATGLIMTTLGDVNGDGYEDFAFTAPLEVTPVASGGTSSTGVTYVYYGPICALDNDPFVTEWFQADSLSGSGSHLGVQTYVLGSEPVGTSVSAIYSGSFSAPGIKAACGTNTASVKPLPLKFTVLGATSDDHYGYGVSQARAKKGDFNNDGYDDFLLGSATTDDLINNVADVGQGVVFFGSALGLNVSDYPTVSLSKGSNDLYRPFIVTPKNADSGSRFFTGNVSTGDVNGDSTADYMITSEFYNGTGSTRGIWIGTFFLFY